jgi:hypothetical protein
MKVNEILGLVIPGLIILPMIVMISAIFVKAMWSVFKSIK